MISPLIWGALKNPHLHHFASSQPQCWDFLSDSAPRYSPRSWIRGKQVTLSILIFIQILLLSLFLLKTSQVLTEANAEPNRGLHSQLSIQHLHECLKVNHNPHPPVLWSPALFYCCHPRNNTLISPVLQARYLGIVQHLALSHPYIQFSPSAPKSLSIPSEGVLSYGFRSRKKIGKLSLVLALALLLLENK